MPVNQTVLSKQEKKWISERRITRLTDNKEVQIYPMGAERFLASVLFKNKKNNYNIKSDIEGKDILVIPGYGNSGFLFAEAGAKSVTVYDKDPVTIAWIKAFKKYYHYREQTNGNTYPSIGDLLTALTQWYPPFITLPSGKFKNIFFWVAQPNSLRRVYLHYILSLVHQAIHSKTKDNFELEKNIQFHTGTIDNMLIDKKNQHFDTAFVPYLLGVNNGIEHEKDIVLFMKKLLKRLPNGHILINPSQNTKEFYLTGKRYFVTTKHKNIQSIPELHSYFIAEDKHWFGTQGLAVFGNHI